MDESGESGRPQSDGAEGLRPSGTDGSAEPTRPDDTPQPPPRPADTPAAPAPNPRPEPPTPVTKPAENAETNAEPEPKASPEPTPGPDPRRTTPTPAVDEAPGEAAGGTGSASGAGQRRVPTLDGAPGEAADGVGSAPGAGQRPDAPAPKPSADEARAAEQRRVPTLDEASAAAGQRAAAEASAADAPQQQPPARPTVAMTKPPRDGQDTAPHPPEPQPNAAPPTPDPPRNAQPAPSDDARTAPERPSAPRPGDPGTPRRPEPAFDGAGRADGKGGGPTPPTGRKNPGGGLLMGRPFGVPVYVAPSWFLVAALITWVFGGQLDRVLPELGGARYLVSLFFAVAFYASVLVHELAHTIAALRFKLPVRRIQLQFFGGVSEIEKETETPGREFVLAFVGPLLSLVLAGVFYAGMRVVEPGTVPGVLLAGLMISNLIVAAFNLLPGLPLDGGRMLRAVVWKITGKPMSGTVAAAWVGRALAISVLIGLPLLNQSGALGGEPQDIGGMTTVTDALLAAILAAIIWTGAGNSLRMARLREHLPELRARTLTRRAVPVESHTPLSEALRRANDAGARALVIVDADGDPMAVVREAAIVSVPQHRRPWVAVSGLAQDITEGMRISAELAGEELLDTLRATPATEYLVVEDSGEIYGVLSAADVERAFVKAMARPS
ncbi:site-2 protease family protein [Streptomyces huasconensis]|uniref:site-2 protease family protein n=1 Tax=Streptomyces huasconensis TaxID=1854574 RepID=UPI0036FCC684